MLIITVTIVGMSISILIPIPTEETERYIIKNMLGNESEIEKRIWEKQKLHKYQNDEPDSFLYSQTSFDSGINSHHN